MAKPKLKTVQEALKITTLEQLKGYSNGQIVELPPFADGQPFVARIKRPSMLKLAENGRIPNSLILTANELFAKGGAGFEAQKETAMKDMMAVIKEICAASFVEPTYDEIIEAGIELTDDQLMFLFNYTQTGVKALESFRKE